MTFALTQVILQGTFLVKPSFFQITPNIGLFCTVTCLIKYLSACPCWLLILSNRSRNYFPFFALATSCLAEDPVRTGPNQDLLTKHRDKEPQSDK